MADLKIGRVDHYFDKINVAVIEVFGTLAIGDQIKFTGSNEFTQKVVSLQIEHDQVESVAKGQLVGLKVDQPVKKGDEVLKVS